MEIIVHSAAQTVTVEVNSETSIRKALDTTGLRVRAACGGSGTCGACVIRIMKGRFNPPTVTEYLKLSRDDLDQQIRLACQLHAFSSGELFLDFPAPSSEWKSLDAAASHHTEANSALTHYIYGVAVDVGTTFIRLSCWNRQTGHGIGQRYCVNPQVSSGADVLTRMNVSLQAIDDSRSLGALVRHAIIEGIRDILSRELGEVGPILKQIGKVIIVGNTAMLTLICGESVLDLNNPESWQQSLVCIPDKNELDRWRQAWRMPYAEIEIVQPLGGFVGSDLLAAVLASGITEHTQPGLLIDFGTNTEIALWDGRNLWATSVPGGPAFEESGVRNGMSGFSGAICSVDYKDDELQFQTLDGAESRGFCATGLIDIIALLLDKKLLKPSGRFADSVSENSFQLVPGNAKTTLYKGDIDFFQRAKASLAAAIVQLLKLAKLNMDELSAIWICGSFTQHLNLENASRVGLLPQLMPDKFRILKHASLSGCERLLLQAAAKPLGDAIAACTRVINLGGDMAYEDAFIKHLRLQPMSDAED